MTAADPLSLVGQTLDAKYRVESFVAEGGFSLVYRARHAGWGQPVAVKLLKNVEGASPEQREELLKSFVQEGALLREMSSRTACILQAHDIGGYSAPDGRWHPFLVLEWLEGATLEAIVEQQMAARAKPWSLDECMTLLEPAARALSVVHKRGVAHRDLKPANLFVIGEPRSSDAFVKILDFGIAKVVTEATGTPDTSRTAVGITSFTPAYGAPEQFSRASYGATGPWTDVYAFALVLVELMTLAPPLRGEDVAQLAHASTDPSHRPTPAKNGASVSREVEDVFAKALALHPRDRFASMGEFWSALWRASGRSIVPPAPPSSRGSTPEAVASTVPEIAPPPKNHRRSLVLGALGLGAAAVLGARLVSGGSTPAAPPPNDTSVAPLSVASASAASSLKPPPPACPSRMALIPGGPFFMGYEGDGALDFEKPVHPVTLSAFCIDRTEVTVAMYKACSDAGRCPRAGTSVAWPDISAREKKIYSPLCNEGDAARAEHPINCVTWEMARAYCASISARLPTSAEWELAVRGPDGRVYPWGDDPPDGRHLNACGKECATWGREHGEPLPTMHADDDGFATTAPVGSFPAGRSRYGLDDVIGNVMEWVSDWDGPYARSDEPVKDPRGPEAGTRRVIRGGAWNASERAWVRPSFRFSFPPDVRSHAVGLRCAAALSVPVEPAAAAFGNGL